LCITSEPGRGKKISLVNILPEKTHSFFFLKSHSRVLVVFCLEKITPNSVWFL
jgi:hypothetical protein